MERSQRSQSGWAVGFTAFAAFMMLMIGMFQIFNGLGAIFENEFYVVTKNYFLEFDVTTWGVIHLIIGIGVVIAGLGLFTGARWARILGVVIAVLSAISNFAFIPYQPAWSLT